MRATEVWTEAMRKKPQILVLEDDPVTARLIERTLVKCGYGVSGVVASGEECLALVAATRPDLLLADIVLEGQLDGVSVAEHVRRVLGIPTVFLTAHFDESTMRRVRVTEPHGYLLKPIDGQELHATIEIALMQHSLIQRKEELSRINASLLRRSREELIAVTEQLIGAQETERQRIAGDLHDDTSQSLAALQIDLQLIKEELSPPDQERTKDHFHKATSRLEKIASEVRALSHSLHPSMLDHLGLKIALGGLVDDFRQRQSMVIHFSTRNLPGIIEPATALAVYRIVQEALQNIAKHAGPAQVSIAVVCTRKSLRLSIRDTGRGFDVNGAKRGLGIVSMAQRAQSLGGEFELQSKPGEGTRIHVHIPAPAATPPART